MSFRRGPRQSEAEQLDERHIGASNLLRLVRKAMVTRALREHPTELVVPRKWVEDAEDPSGNVAGPEAHVPLHQLTIDQLEPLAVRHGEKVIGGVTGLDCGGAHGFGLGQKTL